MTKPNKLGEKLSYESYCCLRQGNEPAYKVYQVWKEQQLKRDSMDICQLFGESFTGVMVYMLVANIVANLFYVDDHKIWITSPSGKTTRQLLLCQALRIIKKKQWRFTQVAPVKVESPISRKSALKILLFGNNNRKVKKQKLLEFNDQTV